MTIVESKIQLDLDPTTKLRSSAKESKRGQDFTWKPDEGKTTRRRGEKCSTIS